MKNIKLFKLAFLVMSFLLLFNCNDDEVVKEEIEKVTFSDFRITASSGINSLVLDWEDVTVSNKQKVTYDVYLNETLKVENLTNSTFTLKDLEADTEYSVKVKAKDEGNNAKEVKESFKTALKPVPTDVTITSKDIKNSSFTIDWTAAVIDGDKGVVYDIYLDEVKVASDLDVLTYTFADLETEKLYNVKVIAKSNEFETTSTQIIEVTTSTKPVPSDDYIIAVNVEATLFTIEWEAAAIEGDKGVVYDIYLDDVKVASDLDVLTYIFSDLEAEKLYNVKIIAKSNEFGTTSTQTLEVTTLAKPVPSNDYIIAVNNVETSSFTIEWGEATIEGDKGVVYDIYLDEVKVVSDLDVLTYAFSGLEAGKLYNVKLIAKSNEFGTTSTQNLEVTTKDGPLPNDFTITLDDVSTRSARISWTSLTIDGTGGVFADIYINGREEATGLTSVGYVLTGLEPNTNYAVKVVARSSEYGTTLEKEISVKTESLPTTFEVTSAVVSPRTTGTFASAPRIVVRFSNRDLLDNIVLNGTTYSSYAYAGDDGIIITLSDAEFDNLKNATVKEGTAKFTENGMSSSKTFTYSVR